MRTADNLTIWMVVVVCIMALSMASASQQAQAKQGRARQGACVGLEVGMGVKGGGGRSEGEEVRLGGCL